VAEAVYHFNLYMFLFRFLENRNARVYPEFPTGNGKIDLIVEYQGRRYGLELKSYTDERAYHRALEQAAHYGQQLKLPTIYLIFFVESIDDSHRKKYETPFNDSATGVTVSPCFVKVGSSCPSSP